MNQPVPRVVAHRGDSAHAPENTRAAFDLAVQAGADGIELDLQISRDGELFCYHDDHLRKIGQGDAGVARRTGVELDAMDSGVWFAPAFAGVEIPRLEPVLRAYAPRLELLLEVKPGAGRRARARAWRTARDTLRLAERLGFLDRVMLLSFLPHVLRRARAHFPGARTVLNLAKPPTLSRARSDDHVALHAFSVDINRHNAAFARQAREWGVPVYAYTCNTRAQLEKALRLGCELVMSDDPRWARETLLELVGEKG